MDKRVYISKHAAFRISERGLKFGLDNFEAKRRVLQTLRFGSKPKGKHESKVNKTKYLYFDDNLSFYVIFSEGKNEISIKTAIIEQGRE